MICTKPEVTSDASQLLVFVTGIPSKAKTSDILDHFSRCGDVQMHKLRGPKEGNRVLQANPSSNIRRGFCILQANDPGSFERVLGSTTALFQGRTLAISPFRQGKELMAYNQSVNARRVIIKKVPASTDPEALRLFLELGFGQVSRIYRYEAESFEKAIKKCANRKTNSYSIEFSSEEAALNCASIGSFRVPGFHSLSWVEQYRPKIQSNQNRNSNLPSRPSHLFQLKPQRPLAKNLNSKHHQVKNLPRGSGRTGREARESHLHYLDHADKPTTRQYLTRPLHSSHLGIENGMPAVRYNLQRHESSFARSSDSFRKRPIPQARETQQTTNETTHYFHYQFAMA